MSREQPTFAVLDLEQHSCSKRCVAVLGGSFDPVHNGHLSIAHAALNELGADEVRFMPSKKPPHKPGFRASDTHRLAMLRYAITDEPRFRVDTAELDETRTSYSTLSMRELRQSLGDACSICFLMGWDSLQTLDTWWQWQDLFELVNIVVVKRPGYSGLKSEAVQQELNERLTDKYALKSSARGQIALLSMPDHDASSSETRQKIMNESELCEYALPGDVIRYIKEHGLYGYRP